MKKLLYLLMLLPLCLGVSSCSDDNDFPSVDLTVKMTGAANVDNVIYVVQGDPFGIESISVTSLTGKQAMLSSVGYYWDGVLSQVAPAAPYSITWDTSSLGVGSHLLQMQTSLLQVDKSLATAVFTYRVQVVASADDLPDGATLGTVTNVMTVNPK